MFVSSFEGRDVLISELDVGDPVPIQSQIARITDNEKIGVNISNRGRRTLIIEKTGQSKIYLFQNISGICFSKSLKEINSFNIFSI